MSTTTITPPTAAPTIPTAIDPAADAAIFEACDGDLPDRVTHRQVVKACMVALDYIAVCRFFTLSVEDAAVAVHGAVEPTYPLDTANGVIARFVATWGGCPDEGCHGGWTTQDIDAGRADGPSL